MELVCEKHLQHASNLPQGLILLPSNYFRPGGRLGRISASAIHRQRHAATSPWTLHWLYDWVRLTAGRTHAMWRLQGDTRAVCNHLGWTVETWDQDITFWCPPPFQLDDKKSIYTIKVYLFWDSEQFHLLQVKNMEFNNSSLSASQCTFCLGSANSSSCSSGTRPSTA